MGARTNWYGCIDFSILTAATGVVTVTQQLHTIAAQADTSPIDDLVTITAGHTDLTLAGNTIRPLLILRADVGDTITLKHGTGNIYIPGGDDVILTENNLALLLWDGTHWHLMNAVGQAQTYTVTNGTPDRTFDANASSTAELADVLYTLLLDLASMGLLKQA